MTEEKEDTLLIPRDQYLAAGIHIGTQIKTQDMLPFIYRITRAGLYVIDIRQTDARMRIAAKFIARFDPNKVVVVSARRYGHNPIMQFAHITNTHAIPGRFIPGTLTNPNARSFRECELLIITDPRADKQALKEAKIAKIPVMSFCDTDNNLSNIDVCVPANNRGRKALALIFWLLTRQVLLEKGEIARPEDFTVDVNSFQSRGLVSYEPIGDRAKIMEQLKEEIKTAETPEGEKVPSSDAEIPSDTETPPSETPPPTEIEPATVSEKPEEPLPISEETSEPSPSLKDTEPSSPPESAEKTSSEEAEGDVIKPEDLIEGPLPEKKSEKSSSDE